MVDVSKILDIIVASFGVMAAIAGIQSITYAVFHWLPLIKLVEFIPVYLRSFKISESLAIWFESQTVISGSLYNAWKVIFLLIITSIGTLFLTAGFWVVLIGTIAGFFHQSAISLIVWFFILMAWYLISAAIQSATIVFARHLHEKKDLNQVIGENFAELGSAFGKQFFLDWVRTPYITAITFIILVMMVIVHWPAWIWNSIFGRKYMLDLSKKKVMIRYYQWFTYITVATAAILLFVKTIR